MANATILKRDRACWIDCAKFLAIVAVILDHTNGVLYTDQSIVFLSAYSTGLFILMMGVTTFWSLKNRKCDIKKKLRDKCWGILRPYMVATFIYCIFIYRSFDLQIYINHVLYFNASSPFYYVLLYLQLVLISPLIYNIFEIAEKHTAPYIEILGLIFVLLISILTTNYTNILSVYGGGGKLFGGNYLVLFYLGMCGGRHYKELGINKTKALFCLILNSVLIFVWWRFITYDKCHIDSFLPFGAGYNPPGISFIVYAVLIAIDVYLVEIVLLGFFDTIKPLDGGVYLGKHTLYIFLYHRFFLDIVFKQISFFKIENIWLKRIGYFTIMIFGSILLEFILEKIHNTIECVYQK